MSTAALEAAAASVLDPELPVVTIADLGILREVSVAEDGAVTVTITPTYSGCPAMDEIEADVRRALTDAGATRVEVRSVLSPAWTTDWITPDGLRLLHAHGIAPPGPRTAGPVPLTLGPAPARAQAPVPCPQCGSRDTEELAHFSSTACKALWRCRACREPFDHLKAH